MKRRWIQITALVLVLAFAVCPLNILAAAGNDDGSAVEPQASNYISSTYADITNNGGSVTVSFNILGTNKMDSLGAQKIEIKNSSGTVVKTFYYYNTAGMMGYSKYSHSNSVTWTGGSASAKYYAVVTFKAVLGTGHDDATYITGYS